MRRGQQAQPHSSHTTRRHPRKEGTQRQQPPTIQEEKTSTTISPSSFPRPQGNGKTRGHHTTHTEQANPHPSMTRHKISCHPALNGTRSPTQRSHTRCITPTGK
ncbi:hypothetical protein TcCL_NonESM10075 [Trypanosoma cruzi]|nr:hypothetical protein TcCL_NonESM10075 [Trypanosoma cruzi]